MFYEDKEVAEIARLYGEIQYNMRTFIDSKVPIKKKMIAETLLNQIEMYH